MIRIKEVKPQADYTLMLTFTNGQKGIFDVKPYIAEGGVFANIANPVAFQNVKVSHGTIEWLNEIDLCPDCVYIQTAF
jgi:hypothetical protein